MAFEQTSVGARPRGQVGQLSSINLQYDEDQLIAAGLSAQSVAITVASAVNGATYQLTESNLGEVATYVADGSATTTEIAAGLAAAWNANPMLASLGLASAVLAVCTIPMRSTNDGQDVAVITSTGDTPANLTIVNTAASLGSVVPYGVLIYQDADGNATTTRPASGTIPNVLLGLSFYQYNSERAPFFKAMGTQPGDFVRILRTGGVLVADGDDASYNDPVYVGVAGDGEANQLFNAAAGSRELQSKQLMRWVGPNEIEITIGR